MFPLTNVPEPVRHALDVIGSEIGKQLAGLSSKEQIEFWTEIHGYALARTREKSRPPLVTAGHLEESVRRALQLIDGQIRTHTAALGARDQERFWEALKQQSERNLRG